MDLLNKFSCIYISRPFPISTTIDLSMVSGRSERSKRRYTKMLRSILMHVSRVTFMCCRRNLENNRFFCNYFKILTFNHIRLEQRFRCYTERELVSGERGKGKPVRHMGRTTYVAPFAFCKSSCVTDDASLPVVQHHAGFLFSFFPFRSCSCSLQGQQMTQ